MAHDDSIAVRLRERRQEQQSHKLELAYEKSIREVEIVCESEKLRRMRLNVMMLEDANDDLHNQLAQDDARIDEMQIAQDDLQSQLEASTNDAERTRSEIRQKDREIETLKAELKSLQGVSVDSSKLLTEKLTLSRELAALKPEVEHLRAQVSSDQSLLAEKLALQRQVSSLQVELETEKRAAQRATAKQDARQAEDNKAEIQIQSLQAELAKEQRERQRIETQAQKAAADFESKQTVLESRLDAFRNKLRLTKEQLKDSQSELQNRATSVARQSDLRVDGVFEAARNPRKRSAAQVDFDSTIGTPGAQPAAKRGKRGSTLPGEKSTFSITPFLNRTASVAPESPAASHKEESPTPADSVNGDNSLAQSASPSGKPKGKAARTQKATALGPAKAGKTNTRGRPPKSTAARKASVPPKLDQVTEEGEEGGSEDAPVVVPKALSALPEETRPLVSRESVEPTFIKKKRKILGGGLGKTIFDEDEGETTKGKEKGLFGAKDIGTFGMKKGLGGIGVKLGPKPGLGGSAGFGAFSPLKKDRKLSGA